MSVHIYISSTTFLCFLVLTAGYALLAFCTHCCMLASKNSHNPEMSPGHWKLFNDLSGWGYSTILVTMQDYLELHIRPINGWQLRCMGGQDAPRSVRRRKHIWARSLMPRPLSLPEKTHLQVPNHQETTGKHTNSWGVDVDIESHEVDLTWIRLWWWYQLCLGSPSGCQLFSAGL